MEEGSKPKKIAKLINFLFGLYLLFIWIYVQKIYFEDVSMGAFMLGVTKFAWRYYIIVIYIGIGMMFLFCMLACICFAKKHGDD